MKKSAGSAEGLVATELRSPLAVNRILPAYAQVAAQLRELIVTGQLSPGDQLPTEAELATVFGVSRSTVREALRSLSAQSLVYTSRGVTGGTFVAYVDPEMVSDFLRTSLGLLSGSAGVSVPELLEARAVLEVPSARFAALRRTDEHLAVLRENTDIQLDDEAARFEKNQRFHTILLDASGNRLLEIVTAPVFEVLRSRFRRDALNKGYWTKVDDDHRDILSYIEAQDPDGAEQAMSEHLERLEVTYRTMDLAATEAESNGTKRT